MFSRRNFLWSAGAAAALVNVRTGHAAESSAQGALPPSIASLTSMR